MRKVQVASASSHLSVSLSVRRHILRRPAVSKQSHCVQAQGTLRVKQTAISPDLPSAMIPAQPSKTTINRREGGPSAQMILLLLLVG